ncbi:hypothetical protein [Sphingopyxis chilensis]|jgi:hypothetical protein|uniref:hypothetical protein n=1 Tax=Sphingopyxis chilensis TaxID=180400 RepID=UPI002DDCE760|nr:hypothetical protein [Sphingopyxis chilensis]
MDDTPHNPATIPAPGSYHWTSKLQREFLEAFATNGSVKISAAKVGMSPSAVYQLKQRPEGAAFKLGCAAALLIARGRHEETSTILRKEGPQPCQAAALPRRSSHPRSDAGKSVQNSPPA